MNKTTQPSAPVSTRTSVHTSNMAPTLLGTGSSSILLVAAFPAAGVSGVQVPYPAATCAVAPGTRGTAAVKHIPIPSVVSLAANKSAYYDRRPTQLVLDFRSNDLCLTEDTFGFKSLAAEQLLSVSAPCSSTVANSTATVPNRSLSIKSITATSVSSGKDLLFTNNVQYENGMFPMREVLIGIDHFSRLRA